MKKSAIERDFRDLCKATDRYEIDKLALPSSIDTLEPHSAHKCHVVLPTAHQNNYFVNSINSPRQIQPEIQSLSIQKKQSDPSKSEHIRVSKMSCETPF